MPTRLSEILGVTRDQLEEKGVYDSMIDYDSRLHIDPALASRCLIPEFIGSSQKITNYFDDVLKLIRNIKTGGDPFWKAALKKLTFGEGLNTGLGYSQKGTAGSGIGPDIAERILDTALAIVRAGTSDPAIFELVPVFEQGIGPDRISDMTSKILKPEFEAFTKRIAGELKVDIPKNEKGQPFVFVPSTLLSNLPISEQWEDVDVAAAYNAEVRDSLNSLIGKSWRQTASETTKNKLKELLVENPVLLKELLKLYKNRVGHAYNFVVDHLGIMLWDILGPQFVDDNPVNFNVKKGVTADNVFKVVVDICKQFQKLIENNGLVEHLYDSTGKKRPERFPQLLLFAIADSYCFANQLDLNREINAGSGALDFKVSSGLAKVNLEIKYSSNPKLVEGYEKQLPTYNRAEGVEDKYSIYLVLRINEKSDNKIKKIHDTIKDRNKKDIQSPGFIVIDAIIKPSASKR